MPGQSFSIVPSTTLRGLSYAQTLWVFVLPFVDWALVSQLTFVADPAQSSFMLALARGRSIFRDVDAISNVPVA